MVFHHQTGLNRTIKWRRAPGLTAPYVHVDLKEANVLELRIAVSVPAAPGQVGHLRRLRSAPLDQRHRNTHGVILQCLTRGRGI
jgi:hypothetical protein